VNYTWPDFLTECRQCKQCPLSASRKNVVIYRGAIEAPLMIVGEGPGAHEDEQGEPFVGQAGRLLNLLLEAYGFTPNQYHICNIVKCRPPENRVPTQEEAKSCLPLLAKQIRFAKPKVIVLLGGTAYKYFLNPEESISKARGNWIEKSKFLIMPTFHPAYILRNNRERISLWKDIGMVRNKLEELGLMDPLTVPPDMPAGRG
jgi:uracil-DNA glycosylase family 4